MNVAGGIELAAGTDWPGLNFYSVALGKGNKWIPSCCCCSSYIFFSVSPSLSPRPDFHLLFLILFTYILFPSLLFSITSSFLLSCFGHLQTGECLVWDVQCLPHPFPGGLTQHCCPSIVHPSVFSLTSPWNMEPLALGNKRGRATQQPHVGLPGSFSGGGGGGGYAGRLQSTGGQECSTMLCPPAWTGPSNMEMCPND